MSNVLARHESRWRDGLARRRLPVSGSRRASGQVRRGPATGAESRKIAGYVSPVDVGRPVEIGRRRAIPTNAFMVTEPAVWDSRPQVESPSYWDAAEAQTGRRIG